MSATTTQTQPTQTLSGGAPSGPVTVQLSFYEAPADGSAPWNYVEPQPSGVQRNFGQEWHAVPLQDMRGRESGFELDTHAFQALASQPPSAADFTSDESIRAAYYPEVEALLQAELSGAGPKRVVLFDHTVRRALPGADRAPVSRTHIDQTAESAAERVRLHTGAEAEQLLKGRVRIVNVWRPINGAVESFPLAVADSSSVADDGLLPVEHRYPERTGYTAAVRHDTNMRWWYWSGMGDDDRLLLQCYDSESLTRVPHSAFEDPRSTPASKHRESIEVRALIFG